MLSEEDKNQIVERLRTEEQIRKELHGTPQPCKFAWLESKLFLLVAGFVLTGVLVPLFQFTQGTITWKRQNRYDNVKYRLTMMRDGMTEFVKLWALTVQTYQRLQPFVQSPALSPNQFEAFQKESADLENRSADQSAKVTSLLIHFTQNDGKGDLSRQFDAFLGQKTLFVQGVRQYVDAKRGNPPKQADDPERILGDLNEAYQGIIQKMKQQIERMENENERFL